MPAMYSHMAVNQTHGINLIAPESGVKLVKHSWSYTINTICAFHRALCYLQTNQRQLNTFHAHAIPYCLGCEAAGHTHRQSK